MSAPLLTKEETSALWHAVTWMTYCVSALPAGEGEDPAAVDLERHRLKMAKQALRKVNAIRKEQRRAKPAKRSRPALPADSEGGELD